MRAVAERLNVSVMTVSRALRNDSGVSEATRLRVLKAADEIGYRPNPMMAALMTNIRSGRFRKAVDTIAYLTSHEERDGWKASRTFRSFHEGAHERAKSLGFQLKEFWLREPGMTEARMSRILRARGIHGLVVAPFPVPGIPIDLIWDYFAVAAIGYSLRAPVLHRAANHQIHSIRLALDTLTDRGYRRIGLALEAANDERADRNWITGLSYYQREIAARDRVPPLLPERLVPGGVKAWMNRWRPDAVIGARLELVDWLTDAGYPSPEEIGFVNIDHYPAMSGLDGVDQNSRYVGAAAVDLVAEQLYHNERGIPKKPKVVLIEGEWVSGKSLR